MEYSFEEIKSKSYLTLKDDCIRLREYLIKYFMKNGGHVGSNLGVIELLVALFKEFDYDRDDFLFDIGHQAYLLKLLNYGPTKLDSIRKHGGLSGFMNKSENPKDLYFSGHAGTGLSFAVGLLRSCATPRSKGQRNIICIIGDGAFGEGLSLEALNNVTDMPYGRLIIILNDNNWAIEENIGSLSRIFRNSDKAQQFFNMFGLDYYNCADGHDVELVGQVLRKAKNESGNCVIHIRTCKGYGLDVAEKDVRKLHYSGPFSSEDSSTNSISAQLRYVDINSLALVQIARKCEDLVVITAAMRGGNGLDEFQGCFPERFIDVGMAEQHALCAANGLSAGGKIPVVCLHSAFLPRAYDQLIQDICLPNIHALLLVARSGFSGPDGPTHHGLFDLTYLRCIPNLNLMCPNSGNEYYRLIEHAVFNETGPCVIVTPHSNTDFSLDNLPEKETVQRGIDLVFEGKEVLIITVGTCFPFAIEARKNLIDKGFSVGLFYIRWAKPFDSQFLKMHIYNYEQVIVMEESSIIGGIGSEISAIVAEESPHPPIFRCGVGDWFMPHGDIEKLRSSSGMLPALNFTSRKGGI